VNGAERGITGSYAGSITAVVGISSQAMLSLRGTGTGLGIA
jgi:hypothetical protein